MQVFFPLANWNLSVLSLACSALCFLFSFCHRKLILNCQARQLTQESIRSLIVFIYFIVGALSLSGYLVAVVVAAVNSNSSSIPQSAVAVVVVLAWSMRLRGCLHWLLRLCSPVSLSDSSTERLTLRSCIHFHSCWIFIYIFWVHNVLTAAKGGGAWQALLKCKLIA